jgi:hypothetical protein
MVARTLTVDQIAALRLPTAESILAAADALPHLEVHTWRQWDARPGTFLEAGPGFIRFFRTAAHRVDAAADRALQRSHRDLQHRKRLRASAYHSPMATLTDGDLGLLDPSYRPPGGTPSSRTSHGKIVGWSRKSKNRMQLALRALDYTPLYAEGLEPAMVTLTMPGEWEHLAPTPEDFKAMVNRFRSAYRAAWGESIRGVWKMEFQSRGAPHLHVLMTPPAGLAHGVDRLEFRFWLSRAWARAVGAEGDERRRHERAGTGVDYVGEAYRDPQRIAVYFGKHGAFEAKDYQNEMPRIWRDAVAAGAQGARFWGVWGLEKASAVLLLDALESNSEIDGVSSTGMTYPGIIGDPRIEQAIEEEERRQSATDASVGRACQRAVDTVGTGSSDLVQAQRYARKLSRALAMAGTGRRTTVTRADGTSTVYRAPELVRNKHGQLVLPRESHAIKRVKFESPDLHTGEMKTRRRYRIGYYHGGSGFLLLNDGEKTLRNLGRVLDRRANWTPAA